MSLFHLIRSKAALSADLASKDRSIALLEKLVADATRENEQLTERLTLANHLIFKQGTELAAAEAQVKAANDAWEIVRGHYEELKAELESLRT
jgi:chromosome segregation ATPase